jgi:hypothetical protein
MYKGTKASDEDEESKKRNTQLGRGESSMSVGDGRLWDEDKKVDKINFEKPDYLIGPEAKD